MFTKILKKIKEKWQFKRDLNDCNQFSNKFTSHPQIPRDFMTRLILFNFSKLKEMIF